MKISSFKIVHKTEYRFDSDVFLEPHYFRFRPYETSYLKLTDFSIEIQKQPAGHRIILDEDSTKTDFCWFDGLTNRLRINVESILEISPFNPFNFIIHPTKFSQIPFQYSKTQQQLLGPTLVVQTPSESLLYYGNTILKTTNFDTLKYVTQLNHQVHRDFKLIYREEGPPLAPEETFKLKTGSCRDLSWMLINLLRQQGIAARFVSGYLYLDMDEPAYELHAWVELFLPGAGWLGIDPSHGMFTGNTHFAVASSSNFEQTMPVSGGIRGSATSKLITKLSIEKIS